MLVNDVKLIEEDDMVCLSARRNNGEFEPETFAFLSTIEPKGTFVDIGAYTGIYGIWAAKRGYNVQMFEPHPVTYERMLNNMSSNGVVCNCHNAALSDSSDSRKFFMNQSLKMTSAGSLVEGRGKTSKFEVRTYPYNQFVLGNESVIKIDVEGAELSVLKGMRSVLELEKPVFIIEVLDRTQENEVVAYLKPFGYSLHSKLDERNAVFVC